MEKTKISVVIDKTLADRLRQRQERLSEQLGARISLSQAAVSLLTRALELQEGR